MLKMTPEERSAVARKASADAPAKRTKDALAREAKRQQAVAAREAKRKEAAAKVVKAQRLADYGATPEHFAKLPDFERFIFERVCLDGKDPTALSTEWGLPKAKIRQRLKEAVRMLKLAVKESR